LNYKQNRIPLK